MTSDFSGDFFVTMDCFKFLRRGPRPSRSPLPQAGHHPSPRAAAGIDVTVPVRSSSQLLLLPAGSLEEALRALPLSIEISTDTGVVFSNRCGPQEEFPTVVPLSEGVTLRYWGDVVQVAATPSGAGILNAGESPTSAIRDNASGANHVDLESIPIPAWFAQVADGALTTFRVNARWASFIGTSPGDIPVHVWRDALHPDDVAGVSDNWKRAIASGCEYSSELRLRRGADGEYLWFRGRAHPLRDKSDTVVAYLGVTMDIDDAVRYKKHLEVEQLLLESVVDQLPVGIFIRRAAGESMFNRKIREIWELTDSTIRQVASTEESAKYFASHASHVDGRACLAAEMPSVRAFHGEVVLHEEMYYTPDGSKARLISIGAAPVFGRINEIVAAVAVVEDITDIRAREAERLHLLEEERLAKVSAKAQSDFIANMSHELRSPVHGILGLVELLTMTLSDSTNSEAPGTPEIARPPAGLPGGEVAVAERHPQGTTRLSESSKPITQRQYCSAIRECAMLLQSLVSSVLDFSKIDAGLMTLESLPLDLVSIVDRSILLLHASASERGVLLSREASADFPPQLICDPLRIQQIIVNLANNALKFCQGAAGGGRVVIRVMRVPFAEVAEVPVGESALRVGCDAGVGSDLLRTRKCRVLIEVEDNGPGVPPDVAARLFKPFTQADASITRRYGGTGLGLSIVRGLASLMGGSARVVSPNAMGGATFSCCIVMAEQQDAPESDSPGSGSGGHSPIRSGHSAPADTAPDPLIGARILVVDDIRINRLIAQRFLVAHGATVDLAEDGRAGLEAVASAQPPYDVVLMDCHMPVLDGYAASRAIRALPDASRAAVPIIAISASVLQSDIDKSIAAGMSAHVAKPIESAALAACVRRWVPRR